MAKLSRSVRADESCDATFDALFSVHFVAIARYAERRLPDTAAAEDIAAETFLAAWKQLNNGTEVSIGWLYKVAANRISDFYRGTYRHDALEAALMRAAECASPMLDPLDAIALRNAMEKLSPREKEAVLLHYWEGLSASEIGAVLDTSEKAVWTILSRARARMRTMLSDVGTKNGGEKDA